jgi:hypothetical protein
MNNPSIDRLVLQPQRSSENRKRSIARLEDGEPPDLDEARILDWADAFYASCGEWPRWDSGPIRRSGGETWFSVSTALVLGQRGFPPGGSLADFLARHERIRSEAQECKLSPGEIIAWSKAWRKRTGSWPTSRSGEIPWQGGLTWLDINNLLQSGLAGRPVGTTLAVLRSGHRLSDGQAPLTEQQIVGWIETHRDRTGRWPASSTGRVLDAPDESWLGISLALMRGSRGLETRSSLKELVRKRRELEDSTDLPPLSMPRILNWLGAFHTRIGRLPTRLDGPIPEAPGETWLAVHRAFQGGRRGLPRYGSLARLIRVKFPKSAYVKDLAVAPGGPRRPEPQHARDHQSGRECLSRSGHVSAKRSGNGERLDVRLIVADPTDDSRSGVGYES